MALKGDRNIVATEVGYFMSEVASQGVIVAIGTAGSGVGLDDNDSVATVSASASGAKPLGVLLTEVVDIDLSRLNPNVYKDQVALGGKVSIVNQGWVVTNEITGTPTAGQMAVLGASGTVAGVSLGASTWDAAVQPRVGTFKTSKDQNGYARVYIDL